MSDEIVNSDLYREIEVIVQELIKDIPSKVAFFVCVHKKDVERHTSTKQQDSQTSEIIFVRIHYDKRTEFKQYCFKNRIGCKWDNDKKLWSVTLEPSKAANFEQFILRLGGKIID